MRYEAYLDGPLGAVEPSRLEANRALDPQRRVEMGSS